MMDFIHQQFIDDLSLCDELIAFANTDPNRRAGVVYDKGSNGTVHKGIKDSLDSPLDLGNPLLDRYVQQLLKVSDAYVEKFPMANSYAAFGITNKVNVQCYPKGGGFKVWHTERHVGVGHPASRHLVFMTYLNDIDDAGETEFYHQNLKIKPKKGLTVIWPADWTHTHRGVPSMTQEKYIVTGWFNFLEEAHG